MNMERGNPCTALCSKGAGVTSETTGSPKRRLCLRAARRNPYPCRAKRCKEKITYFQVNGVICYVNPWGEVKGYEDVFSKIDMCRKHFAEVGLEEDFVEQFIF